MGEPFKANAIDILPALWDRYGGYLRRDISAVRIVHKFYRCYLEITTTIERPDASMDERIERIDLTAVSIDPDEPIFPGHVSAFVTARKFVEDFNEYDIINCTPLFIAEVAAFISEQHERTHGIPRTPEGMEADCNA